MRGHASPGGPLRVLALTPYAEPAPSTRYRLVQMIRPLRGLGVELTLCPTVAATGYGAIRRGDAGALLAMLRAGRTLASVYSLVRDYDAVLVQRGVSLVFDRSHLRRLRRSGVPLLFDFDDAVFLPQPGGNRWVERLRAPYATTAALCRGASAVLAGNAYLADFARRVVGPGREDRVVVVPSAVDTEVFRPWPRERVLPALGWVGSDSTLPYLESLAPALQELAKRVPHRLIVVAGSRAPQLSGVHFEFVPWSAGGEAEVLGTLDVGLYPLDDTPWTRGKCGFKALQYLACGIPCVASPVGVLRDMVQPGRTGLHAGGHAEWVEACARLLGDAPLRAYMGAQGRALVEERYSVARVAPLVAGAVAAVVGGLAPMALRSVEGKVEEW